MDNNNSELIEYLDEKFQVIGSKFEALENQISHLPTKAYLDDKLADLEGGLITKLRKEDEKVNRLAEILKEKKVLSENDIAELQRLQVFPKS